MMAIEWHGDKKGQRNWKKFRSKSGITGTKSVIIAFTYEDRETQQAEVTSAKSWSHNGETGPGQKAGLTLKAYVFHCTAVSFG